MIIRMLTSPFKSSPLIFLTFCITSSFGQQLLETKDGDALYSPLISSSKTDIRSAALIKTNFSDQTIGAEFYYKLPKIDTSSNNSNRFCFISGGIKAKPTEGYANVFKNGQYSPGTTFTFSINKFKIFDKNATKPDNNFTDWGGFYFGLNVNKYLLYRNDTTFESQIYSKIFSGGELGLNYNMLFKQRYLLSIKAGYSRKSNFSDLDEYDIQDVQTSYDSISSITRTRIKTKAAREDNNYKEFDAWNLKLAFTRLADIDTNSLRIGYSLYADFKSSTISPNMTTTMGLILFLAQTKKSISSPLIGFDFGFADVFDTKHLNNGLFKRFSLGITSVIPIR